MESDCLNLQPALQRTAGTGRGRGRKEAFQDALPGRSKAQTDFRDQIRRLYGGNGGLAKRVENAVEVNICWIRCHVCRIFSRNNGMLDGWNIWSNQGISTIFLIQIDGISSTRPPRSPVFHHSIFRRVL